MLRNFLMICLALSFPFRGFTNDLSLDQKTFISSDLQSFLDLPLESSDTVILKDCMSFLVGKTLDELVAGRDHVEGFLEVIETIHPLRLIGFIFSDPFMHAQVKIVLQTEIISSFVLLLLENVMREKAEEPLFPHYVSGLEDFLNLEKGLIMQYIDQDNYPDLFNFLCFEIQ